MAMSDLVLPLVVGMALGAFYSVNLWSAVKRMADESTPWYVLYGSFLLRMVVVLAGFSLVMGGRWERLLAALCGFVLVRELLVRRLGRSPRTS